MPDKHHLENLLTDIGKETLLLIKHGKSSKAQYKYQYSEQTPTKHL
jgi:hypothetical protein